MRWEREVGGGGDKYLLKISLDRVRQRKANISIMDLSLSFSKGKKT